MLNQTYAQPQWALLDDISENVEEAKHDLRLKNCGRQGRQIRITDGTYKSVYFYCGLHLDCPRCLNYRADKMKKNFVSTALANEASVMVLELPKDEASALLKGITREEYMRYPQGNDKDIVVVDMPAAQALRLKGTVINEKNVDQMPWLELAKTPKGRKLSGALAGRHAPVTDDKVKIKTFTLVTNADEAAIGSAMVNSIIDTANLAPQTPVEVEEAIAVRTKMACNILLSLGFQATMHQEYISYNPATEKIDWSVGARQAWLQLNPESLFRNNAELFLDQPAL